MSPSLPGAAPSLAASAVGVPMADKADAAAAACRKSRRPISAMAHPLSDREIRSPVDGSTMTFWCYRRWIRARSVRGVVDGGQKLAPQRRDEGLEIRAFHFLEIDQAQLRQIAQRQIDAVLGLVQRLGHRFAAEAPRFGRARFKPRQARRI